MQQQIDMQQEQPKRASKAITPPITLETTSVSGGPLVGGLVTIGEVNSECQHQLI